MDRKPEVSNISRADFGVVTRLYIVSLGSTYTYFPFMLAALATFSCFKSRLNVACVNLNPSFSNACTRPLVRPADNSDYKFGHATHGYHPDKGPQPTLLACGPHIRPGVVLERRPIVDEAPTYARILGVSLPDAEGTAIEEILTSC